MRKPPAHQDLKELLRSRIERGEFAVGERVPSEHQLVEQLGVGRSRARQALRELELEGYLIRRRGSGSYVTPGEGRISAVRVAAPGTVAMILPLNGCGYSREVVQGFTQATGRAGIQTIVYNVQPDAISEARALRNVVDSGVTGMAVWIEHDAPAVRSFLQGLLDDRFPIVLVDRYIEGLSVDCVASANEEIGYRLARALVENGHQRIAFAGYKEATSSIRDRFRGYRRALAEREGNGAAEDGCLLLLDSDLHMQPSEAVKGLMALRDRPTAFVCIHDGAAARVYRELITLGFNCPGDVEFAAVDDHDAPEPLSFPFISVTQRAREIGLLAARTLVARTAQPELSYQRYFLEPEPIGRDGVTESFEAGKGGPEEMQLSSSLDG